MALIPSTPDVPHIFGLKDTDINKVQALARHRNDDRVPLLSEVPAIENARLTIHTDGTTFKMDAISHLGTMWVFILRPNQSATKIVEAVQKVRPEQFIGIVEPGKPPLMYHRLLPGGCHMPAAGAMSLVLDTTILILMVSSYNRRQNMDWRGRIWRAMNQSVNVYVSWDDLQTAVDLCRRSGTRRELYRLKYFSSHLYKREIGDTILFADKKCAALFTSNKAAINSYVNAKNYVAYTLFPGAQLTPSTK